MLNFGCSFFPIVHSFPIPHVCMWSECAKCVPWMHHADYAFLLSFSKDCWFPLQTKAPAPSTMGLPHSLINLLLLTCKKTKKDNFRNQENHNVLADNHHIYLTPQCFDSRKPGPNFQKRPRKKGKLHRQNQRRSLFSAKCSAVTLSTKNPIYGFEERYTDARLQLKIPRS